MDIGSYYVLVQQVGDNVEDLWTVRAIDEASFNDIASVIGTEGVTAEEIDNVISDISVVEEIVEYEYKDQAKELAYRYADEHPITLIVTVPYL